MKDDFFSKNRIDNEEVPYMNNDGDLLQDSIKEIKLLTEDIQKSIMSRDNVVKVDFSKNANKKCRNSTHIDRL